MTSVRRQPKWDTRAGLAKVQIGGLPKSIGVWDSGRGQTKGGSVHGEDHDCSDRTPCAAHDQYKKVYAAYIKFLEKTNIAKLAKSADELDR